MKRFVLRIGLLFLMVGVPLAQNKKQPRETKVSAGCTISEAPRIRGFYLGQTIDDIGKFIPDFHKAYDERMGEMLKFNYTFTLSNYSRIVKYPAEIGLLGLSSSDVFLWDEDKQTRVAPLPELENVNIDWFFFNGSLFSFVVYYRDYEPASLDDFQKQASKTLGLPEKGWQLINNKSESLITCDGFTLSVDVGNKGNFPHITVVDLAATKSIMTLEKEIIERKSKEEQDRLKVEQEKRRTFKP